MKFALAFLFFLVYNVQSAKILGVFPIPAPSHYILGSRLMRALAEKGHDVTVINPFGEKNPPKNGKYKDILLTGFKEMADERRKQQSFFERDVSNPFLTLGSMNAMVLEMTELTLNHTNFKKFINSKEIFDVVIVEQFMNEALKALAPHFKAPLITLSTVGANAWVNLLEGNPAPPSYVPHVILSYSSNMSFYERTVNSLMSVYTQLLNQFYVFPKHGELVKKYFPNAPPLDDIIYNTSIVLINSHQSTNQPVPYVPNMIEIGGFHVKPPQKLPKDIQEFLDGAKNGVIYFSLGSNIHSSQLPPEKRDAFLKTFSKLEQKVLWKWEEDVLPGQPPNVKLGKWLPQQDILAHPNVKLFITHGGLLSTTETIYHGKPVLAIPIFGDQKLNAKNIYNNGFGLYLYYEDLTEENLTKKLNELLSNPKYARNAKKRSEIFHDRLVKPIDTAIYWVEYVIRHGGAPHLKVAAIGLPWYKYLLFDVIVFVSVIIVFLVFMLFKCVKIVAALSCHKQKKEKLKNH
ncbi:UDP-glycosyltransferase UGT5-like [Tribolium madens]|uniref:UDP-glycosyltransferase UGT5-like n=1 Tax=Tribolium madens TaxID=41895 RepID=UPI001CF748ED|nr:UDP-glycosyltransferase UGT5-like [Tribolium madens]XP_044262544.1 UDP-glycosyltransferase UGT5-like [Tribolium madens]